MTMSTDATAAAMTHVELAVSSGQMFKRNLITTKSAIKTYKANIRPPKALYRSHWNYPIAILDHVERHGTIKGYNGLKGHDHIVIDIDLDSRQKIPEFLSAWNAFYYQELQPYGLEDGMLLAFSGTGFHLHMHRDSFTFAPSVDLPDQVGAMVANMWSSWMSPYFSSFTFDPALYSASQVYRTMGSYNQKSGLFKIAVPADATAQKMLVASANGKHMVGPAALSDFSGVPEYAEYQTDDYTNWKAQAGIAKAQTLSDYVSEDFPFVGHCYHKLLNMGAQKAKELHGRHHSVFRLANFYFNQSVPIDQARTLIHKWCQQLDDYDQEDTDRCIDDIYSGAYRFGCNDSILSAYCDKRCRLFKNKK